ncbi:MAG TPA: DCC1-like thiol-disulfide oxidoreductase family protein [Flavitalea sp.]|nr:DCC1-like thiol-disulfide oxidoreductase family protein [Flavitalea sp.]
MTEGDIKPIILFDGVCNLCQGSVQFVLKHDTRRQFLFASLQSPVAIKLLGKFKTNSALPDSFVLIENGILFTRSTAALRVCRRLNSALPLLYAFIIIPKFVRDAVYNLIARNRYKWFGKSNECWLPTRELSARFLDH